MTTPMGVGQMRPHFSLGERNGRARSKRDIGGEFRDSPSKPPLKTTRPGGCSTVAAIRFPAPDGAANRAAASKAACMLRHRRRCAAFPYSGLHPRRWTVGSYLAAVEGHPRSGSGRRNQWNTGDGNTARPTERQRKEERKPIRFAPRTTSDVSSRADHWWV